MSAPRYGKRKDNNHNELTAFLNTLGVQVIDLSQVGDDIPDTLLLLQGELSFAEIKNPKSWYGKVGLNDNQKSFAINNGVDVYVISTNDDCKRFASGIAGDLIYRPSADDVLRLSKRGR